MTFFSQEQPWIPPGLRIPSIPTGFASADRICQLSQRQSLSNSFQSAVMDPTDFDLELLINQEDPAPLCQDISAKLSADPPAILLVDDDSLHRVYINRLAQNEGFRVIEAASGEECLSLFGEVQPDIVLLDAVMPGMDGFSCCKRLQEIDGQTPVLIVTALHNQAAIDHSFAAGATDYISKPIHWEVLRQRILRLTQTGRAMKELHRQHAQEKQWIQHIQSLNTALELKVQERTAQLNTQVKELQQLDELKKDFLYSVSHELRTPLSNIKIALKMLDSQLRANILPQQPTETQVRLDRYLTIIGDELSREIKLVNDLLDWQRLAAGTELDPPEWIDLYGWLPKLVNPFRERTQEHHQTLSVILNPGLPSLLSHPQTLGQIIAELLQNACKYTPPGETITLTVALDPDHHQLLLGVCNTGVEIPADQMQRIFDKFYRIPNGDPWKHGGTGLGLALLNKRVTLMGGSVQVLSKNMKTTFTVSLPLTHL